MLFEALIILLQDWKCDLQIYLKQKMMLKYLKILSYNEMLLMVQNKSRCYKMLQILQKMTWKSLICCNIFWYEKCNAWTEAYSEHCQTSTMELDLRCVTWFSMRFWWALLKSKKQILQSFTKGSGNWATFYLRMNGKS